MSIFDDPEDWGSVRLVDIVDPKRQRREEQKEEYRSPARLRIFENIIAVLGREHEELSESRAKMLKEIDRQRAEAERELNEFAVLEERMRCVESKLREAYKKVDEQRMNI